MSEPTLKDVIDEIRTLQDEVRKQGQDLGQKIDNLEKKIDQEIDDVADGFNRLSNRLDALEECLGGTSSGIDIQAREADVLRRNQEENLRRQP